MEPISNRSVSFVRTNWVRAASYGRSLPSSFLENIRILGRLLTCSTPPTFSTAEDSLRINSAEFLRMLKRKKFPDQPIVVRDRLQLDDSYDLKRLPRNLTVESNLCLINCMSLVALPSGLQVDGNLDCEGCTTLNALPTRLRVGGYLSLLGCTLLTELPQGLEVRGDLYICGSTSLKMLSLGLRVEGNLNLSGCTSLTELPAGLYVGGNLDLNGCTSLTALPFGLHVGGNLDFNGCTSLTALPQGLEVGQELSLRECSSLISLPAGLHVGGSLYLSMCTSLTALPVELYVGATLDFSRCMALTELPARLHVGGNLDLFNCTSLRELPEGLHVGGNLNLYGCTSLTSLPNDVTHWGQTPSGQIRQVNLTNTGLSDALIDRLRATEAPGMRFLFSRQGMPVANEYATVAEAVSFWSALLPREGVSPVLLNLRRDQEDELIRFLTRLKATSEYQNLAARLTLAKRIYDVLKEMKENEEFKETACVIIHEGLSTCHDRIISALDELDLMMQIKKAEAQLKREELRKLGRGMLMLEEVQRAAEAHALTLTWVDEIEIQLAFQIGLRDRLQLSLSTGHMIFRSCAQVSDQKIQEVGAEIERKITDREVEAYLQTWSPWQKLLRREAFDALIPEFVDAPSDLDWKCCTTLDELTEGCLYEGRIYSFENLEKIYIEMAVDPFTTLPIDLEKIKRVVKAGAECNI